MTACSGRPSKNATTLSLGIRNIRSFLKTGPIVLNSNMKTNARPLKFTFPLYERSGVDPKAKPGVAPRVDHIAMRTNAGIKLNVAAVLILEGKKYRIDHQRKRRINE